jgi:hypothetical protein
MTDKRTDEANGEAPAVPHIVPMSSPGWDASRPSESFRAFAASIHGQAKEVLVRDGHHSEMLFFMPLDGSGHIVLWRNNDRDLEADWLSRHIKGCCAYGVVHVVEAWARFAAGPNDPTLRQIMGGEIRVSELKPEHRAEALMVSAQSRDGWANCWVDEIVRDADGGPSLGSCRQFLDFTGRFGKLFG